MVKQFDAHGFLNHISIFVFLCGLQRGTVTAPNKPGDRINQENERTKCTHN